MAWMFGPDGCPQQEGELGIRPVVAQDVPHGLFVVGEEAVPHGAVGGKPEPVARATEGLRDTRDETDLTDPVGEAKPLGGSARSVRQRLQRPPCVDAIEHLAAWYELGAVPVSLGIERHYSAYIPNGQPNGFITGDVYIVDLASNTYRWQLSLNSAKQTEGKWDEPPSFPAITNAYFEAIERGQDQILAPLKR